MTLFASQAPAHRAQALPCVFRIGAGMAALRRLGLGGLAAVITLVLGVRQFESITKDSRLSRCAKELESKLIANLPPHFKFDPNPEQWQLASRDPLTPGNRLHPRTAAQYHIVAGTRDRRLKTSHCPGGLLNQS